MLREFLHYCINSSDNASVSMIEEPYQRHHQVCRVESIGSIMHPECVLPPRPTLGQNFSLDLLHRFLPFWHVLFVPRAPRDVYRPLQPSITPCLRIHILLSLATNLPDAVAGLAPVVDNEPGERLHKTIVHVSRNRLAVPRREIER